MFKNFFKKIKQKHIDTKQLPVIEQSPTILNSKEDKPINYMNEQIDTTSIEQDNIETLIQSAHLSDNGLYPHEILMLSYAEKYRVNETNFPQFWLHYGINNPGHLLSSLADRGFINTASVESTLNACKLTDLKNILKKYNLKLTGKKADLIERLIQNISIDELKSLFTNPIYSLTEKGKSELNNNSYITYVHKKTFCIIDIWQANILLHENANLSINDLNWQYLNKECMEHFVNHDFGLYRNTKFCMAEQLLDENKLNKALAILFEVCYWDLSGICDNFSFEFDNLKSYIPYSSLYEISSSTLAPFVVAQISNLKATLELSDKDFKSLYEAHIKNINTPFHIFTKEECFEIIYNKMLGNTENVSNLYNLAEKRLNK